MLTDNYNREWDSVIDCVKFYGEWLHKDIETIINKIKQCEKLSFEVKQDYGEPTFPWLHDIFKKRKKKKH